MKKLMSFDVDGTLLFERKIDHRTLTALKAWQQAGNLAVCNTGKSIYANQVAFEPYDFSFDYYVLYTGAVITDSQYQILQQKTLDLDLVCEVVDRLAGTKDVNVFATTLDHDYQISNGTGWVSNILPAFSALDKAELKEHQYVGIPLWVTNDQLRAEIQAWIEEKFSGRLDCHRNLDFLDIVPLDSNKGSGLTWLVNYLQEPLKVYTIGDSWNDLDMHRVADRSASLAHSPADIQEMTNDVVTYTHEFIDRALHD
ncbi:MAG: HAD family hydrolase [Rothia sp. (in: high G+C Gram-positive bacteria)]|nr:HAD family hydrolase [Rothia sp. (in: high G+C Gram-positive bacteria)]